jgi:uncharacterized protein (TIGR02246 family)
MSIRLSEPLTDYFKAANTHDVSAMLAAFAHDAVVVDEGQRHRGLVAIREWMRKTLENYAFEIDPIESSVSGNDTLVIASVSGTFPGSPITLKYKFKANGGKITGLEIG